MDDLFERADTMPPDELPLETAEKKMFAKLFAKFDNGDYTECNQIIDLMERLSIV